MLHVVGKTIVTLLAITIVIAFSIIVVSSGATALNRDDSGLSAPPLIYILEHANDGIPIDYAQHTNHPIIYTNTGNVSLSVKIRMPYQVYDAKTQGTIMWLGGHLTSVSYKASWQNNQTVDFSTNLSSNQSEYDFNLTNIPFGEHNLEVDSSCVVNVMDTWAPTFHPFYDTNIQSLNFTVAPNITPTPTPLISTTAPNLSTEQIFILIAILISLVIVVIIFYRIHHNSESL